jgi:hypothetical protein
MINQEIDLPVKKLPGFFIWGVRDDNALFDCIPFFIWIGMLVRINKLLWSKKD